MKTDNQREVAIYGAGGHGKVVHNILRLCGLEATVIVDAAPPMPAYEGIPVEKDSGRVYQDLIVAIGNCGIRRKIAERVRAERFLTAVHPTAVIAPGVEIGEGSVVSALAVIQPCAEIGRHCIVNTSAVVEHDVKVSDFVHVASGATVCGGVEIGEGSWIGAGSVVRQGIKIGKDCMIGAGSVVVSDIPDGVTAFGNPCRVRKQEKS